MHERMRETLKNTVFEQLMTCICFVQLDILIEKSAKRNKKKLADLCQLRPFSAHSVSDFKEVFKDEVLYESLV